MLKHIPTISSNDIEEETKSIINVWISKYQNGDIDESIFMDGLERIRGISDNMKDNLYRMQKIVAPPETM